jgi:hypothetical protein
MKQVEKRTRSSYRSSRKLRSGDRVGRHARNLVWKRVIVFLKRFWAPLMLFMILPAVLMAVIPFHISPVERGILVGVMGTSGFWLDVILVILWSGIASTVMGIEGENLTAQVLDDFASKEWSLINGLRFKDKGDIDHILIGPAGLLIFESKWSNERWPMELRPKGYLGRQVKYAIKQVKMNRDDLLCEFREVIGDVPIRLVCVLWSAEDSSTDDRYFYRDIVYGIRGPELANWLKELPKNAISESTIKSIAKPIEAFAHERDKEDVLSDGAFRPTLDRLFWTSLIFPMIGFFVPAFTLAGVAKFDHVYLIYMAMGILLILGLTIWRKLKMRALASSWLLGLAWVCLYVLARVMHWVSR